jgi:site-specific recombinase XerD
MDFEPFLTHWRTMKNCSPQTIKSYRSDLKMFQIFLHERDIRRITQVNHAVINLYIEYMQQKPNPRFGCVGTADASIARRLAAVSSYMEYLRATSNPKLRNPISDLIRKWKKNDDPKPVDEPKLDQLVEGITTLRDRLLIVLFLATGLRISEMHQLDRGTVAIELEIDPSGQERIVGMGEVLGKGGKRRKFFVDDQTLELYAQYLATRTDDNPALFLSERKQRMSVRAIQYTLKAWCQKLGLEHINVHRLRHCYATRLANTHIDSKLLMDLMGHSSLTTTQRYFKFYDTTLAQGYFSAMEFINQQTPISTPQL